MFFFLFVFFWFCVQSETSQLFIHLLLRGRSAERNKYASFKKSIIPLQPEWFCRLFLYSNFHLVKVGHPPYQRIPLPAGVTRIDCARRRIRWDTRKRRQGHLLTEKLWLRHYLCGEFLSMWVIPDTILKEKMDKKQVGK